MRGVEASVDRKRRQRIQNLIAKVTTCKNDFEALSEELEKIYDEESDVMSNLEEYFSQTVNYQVSEAAVSELDDAKNASDEIIDQFENMITSLENAME